MTTPAMPPPDWERQTRFEQYKLAVEMADRVSQRRATANSFFATLVTSILGALAILGGKAPSARWELALGGLGILVCLTWWQHVEHSKRLNSAKFEVIHKLEAQLPAQVFADEWQIAKMKPQRYVGHSRIERMLPLGTCAVFAILVAMRIFAVLA